MDIQVAIYSKSNFTTLYFATIFLVIIVTEIMFSILPEMPLFTTGFRLIQRANRKIF